MSDDSTAPPARLDCVLIAGGKYHDIDFARLELLKLLAEDARIRVRVFEDYARIDAILAADILITYTCDLVPALAHQIAIRDWLEAGGRWLALHGTNSVIEFLDDGRVNTPDWAPHFMHTLGSVFVAHPPIGPYRVDNADPDHALVRGIEPFMVTDEHYLMAMTADVHVLLDTAFSGTADGFVRDQWAAARHPVFYLRPLGAGCVLYLTLGHCRGHYDMQPLIDFYPQPERGAWELPVYYDLLRRGIRWATIQIDEPAP